MARAVEPLGIRLQGLMDRPGPLPSVDESGRDPLENAVLKARAYHAALGESVFSCDSGLYFQGLPAHQQPGTHVRRVDGRELSDEEMTCHYASLAARHGGRLLGRYHNAACLILADGRAFTAMDESLFSEPFLLLSVPHARREPGFPLDCLSADPASGLYYYDQPRRPLADSMLPGFRQFFARCLDIRP